MVFRKLLMGVILAVFPTTGHAQDRSRPQPAAQPSALSECVRIDNAEQRLACYDRVARRDAAQPNTPAAASGIEAQWSGNGLTTTRPFRVSGPWELQWDSAGNFFQVFLYRAGEVHGQAIPNIVANQPGSGSGSSYVPQSGEFYLVVNAIGRWSARAVRVQ
jgi:hypothetical protein